MGGGQGEGQPPSLLSRPDINRLPQSGQIRQIRGVIRPALTRLSEKQGLRWAFGPRGEGNEGKKPVDVSVVRQQTDLVSQHVNSLGGLIVPMTLILPPPRNTIESDWSLLITFSINILGAWLMRNALRQRHLSPSLLVI